MNLWEATQEIPGYVGSKYSHQIIRIRAYLVPRAYQFTRHGWLLAKHRAYPILQKYSYWNIKSTSGVVYVVLRIVIQYQVSRARPEAGIVSAPYEAHVGCLVTSLYNRIYMT